MKMFCFNWLTQIVRANCVIFIFLIKISFLLKSVHGADMKKMAVCCWWDVIPVLILSRAFCGMGQTLNYTTFGPTAPGPTAFGPTALGPIAPMVPLNDTISKAMGREDDATTVDDGNSIVILTFLGLELIVGVVLVVVCAVVFGCRRMKRSFMVKPVESHGSTNHEQQQQAAGQGIESPAKTSESTPMINPVETALTPAARTPARGRSPDELAYTITEIGPLFLRSSSDDGVDATPQSRVTMRPKEAAKRPPYSPPPPPSTSGHSLLMAEEEPVLQYAQLELVTGPRKDFATPLREEKTEYAIILGELQALVHTPLCVYPN